MPTGTVDTFAFAPTKDIPIPTVIAEVTPEEHQQLREGKLPLPRGWSLEGAETSPKQRLHDPATLRPLLTALSTSATPA